MRLWSRAATFFSSALWGRARPRSAACSRRRLGKQFYDADHEIEQRTGVRIAVIFEIEGEAGFRAREAQMVEQLTALDDVVMATGGGAVLAAANRARLAARGFVIYLHGQPRDLYHRTRHDKSRPLLQTANPLAKLEELHRVRDPLYREVADLVVDTGRQSVSALVSQLLQRLPDACKLSA